MKVRAKYEMSVLFSAEDGDRLEVSYDNRGEPYREGISLSLHEPDKPWRSHVFIEKREALELRDLIDELFPRKSQPVTSGVLK